MANHLLLKS